MEQSQILSARNILNKRTNTQGSTIPESPLSDTSSDDNFTHLDAKQTENQTYNEAANHSTYWENITVQTPPKLQQGQYMAMVPVYDLFQGQVQRFRKDKRIILRALIVENMPMGTFQHGLEVAKQVNDMERLFTRHVSALKRTLDALELGHVSFNDN